MTNNWSNLVLKSATPIATTIIAMIVAWISWRQWFTNKEKLRLDLYDRRFRIYVQTMEFHRALVLWNGSEEQRDMVDLFIQAFRESKFLFPEGSGIFAHLQEFWSHASFIVNFDKLKEIRSVDPQEYSKQVQKRTDDVNWILVSIEPLEKMLAPYLNFHDI